MGVGLLQKLEEILMLLLGAAYENCVFDAPYIESLCKF